MIMDLTNIKLYRMTHIKNIPHILRYGLTHKNSNFHDPNFVAIGDSSLIDYRSTKKVNIGGNVITLGDFIPFYFGARMPMLYVIQHGGNFVPSVVSPRNIIYVVVSLKSILDDPGVIYYFTDGHATDVLTTFYDKNNIEELPSIIDWESVKTRQWSGDGIDTDVKRKKQAEFLVGKDISMEHVVGFGCYNNEVKDQLTSMGVDVSLIKVIPDSYY